MIAGPAADLGGVNPTFGAGLAGTGRSAAVTVSDTANVDTVLVNGEIRKRHGQLTGTDLALARARAETSRDRLFAAAGTPDGATPIAINI